MPLATLATGAVFTIFATAAVVADLAELEQGGGRDGRAVVRIRVTIATYAAKGPAYRGDGFKVLVGDGSGLVEFRQDQVRVLGYFDGKGRMVLCHSFTKKTDNTPRSDIRTALLARDSIRKEGG